MALPMMNAIELGAAPQTADPISNRTIADRKVYLTLKMVYNFPKTNKKAQFESRKAVPYQPISFAEWNSFVIWGIAVEMMSLSCGEAS
jgi:hypothetical protein